MKKLFIVPMFLISLLFVGCENQGSPISENSLEKDIADNDSHQGPIGEIDAEIELYEFNDAVSKSDFIAEIEVIDVLKEINDPSPKTIFRAKVIESLKGSSDEKEIFILQQGNGDFVFNENPLFEKGENYLLFLMETVDLNMDISYWILGEVTGMYQVLDTSIAVKLAVKDETLKDIEFVDETVVPYVEKNTALSMDDREMQVLKLDELKNLIKNKSTTKEKK